MKLSTQAINFFEYLAMNAHHQIAINEIVAKQSLEMKEIYLSNSSDFLRNYFSTTGYFADSIKVTEI